MLLVQKMSVEREEGEITEYEDISSDEEILLRQRIAEIEAINIELANLSDKVDEKENANGTKGPGGGGTKTTTEVVALTNVNTRVLRSSKVAFSERSKPKARPKPVTPARKRRRSRRLRRHSCQLIVSDDEFDSYDQLPLGTENLSPDPLPIEDDDDDVQILPENPPVVIVVEDGEEEEEEDDDEDDLELKLRLEALQSKQEIKNDLQIILDQTQDTKITRLAVPTPPPPPQIDEEHELRLIALKSAIVKKHLVRKKRKEEARPYSPTDDALENFDVPSPPLSAQNMDISPLGTPSPLSEENTNAVDMDIANEESQSPIFFSCTINTEPEDPTALSRVEIQIDPSTMVADSGYDDEDPDKLRAFLLEKIGEAAKRKSMRVESDSLTESQQQATAVTIKPNTAIVSNKAAVFERVADERSSELPEIASEPAKAGENGEEDDEDDEHVLRANLLSKAKKFKRDEAAAATKQVPLVEETKPLSEILNEQSKRQQELKTICRTIENPTVPECDPVQSTPLPLTLPTTPVASPKPSTPTRRALIREIPPARVNPVIISLRASDHDSSTEYTDEDAEDGDQSNIVMDLGGTESPMSIAMDSPQYSSSPIAMERTATPVGTPVAENFDTKLSEFLKKARQSTDGAESKDEQSKLAVLKLNHRLTPIKRIVTTRKIVKKVVGLSKTVGLANTIQLGAPAAVRHLPPSTQLEYNRLINRMHQLERQKLIKSRRTNGGEPKKGGEVEELIKRQATLVKVKPSPVKPPSPTAGDASQVTVIRKLVTHVTEGDVSRRSPITVLVHNNNAGGGGAAAAAGETKSVIAPQVKKPLVGAVGLGAAAAVTAKKIAGTTAVIKPQPQQPPPSNGRITLKDRLKSLTAEQMKMLWDVQQRKVVNKRRNLDQSLDSFLETMTETMVANRKQIRTELEVRRLKRMLMQKEQQLAEQRQLCSGQLHERLQGQYKTVVVARQSLAMATVQCQEIGKSVVVTKAPADGEGEKAETSFRLTDEGSEGLGAKFKKYKAEIESYKELRGKIKRGVFTVADLKVEVPALVAVEVAKVAEVKKDETSPVPESDDKKEEKPKHDDDQEVEKKDQRSPSSKDVQSDTPPLPIPLETEKSSNQLHVASSPKEAVKEVIVEGGDEKINALPNGKPEVSFPVYKSPLEAMEYLEEKQKCRKEKSQGTLRLDPTNHCPTPSTMKAFLSPVPRCSTANPNAILCPFQLNGTCQDEGCSYRHLSSSSSS